MTSVTTRDHVYANLDGEELSLTVHRDEDVSMTAVLVYFHGGGWAGGSRLAENVITRLVPLTSQGIIVVSADYRLTDRAVWPAQLEDASAAVEWVTQAYPGLPLFVAGSSAGGHLASLVGLGAAQRLPDAARAHPVDGVITYATVADPLQWDAERLHEPLPEPGTFAHWSYSRHGQWPPGGLGGRLLDGADTRVPPGAYSHVDVGAPPFLLIHGDRDTCVSYRESVQLLETLSRRGNTAYLLEIAGADHEDPRFDEPFVRGSITAFINQFAGARARGASTEETVHV